VLAKRTASAIVKQKKIKKKKKIKVSNQCTLHPILHHILWTTAACTVMSFHLFSYRCKIIIVAG